MRRSLPALLAGLACAVAAAAVWAVALRTGWGASLDARMLAGFVGLGGPRVNQAAEHVAGLADPAGFAFFAFLIIGIALVRGRARLTWVVAGVLVAANVTTQVLKRGLPEIDTGAALGPGGGAWPSGHAT